jgi:hypothetical protein
MMHRISVSAVVLAAALACGTDLQRDAGELEVAVTSLPAGVDRVRIEVGGSSVDDYRVDVAASGGEVTHLISSVPASEVEVRAIASAAGVVEGQGQRSVVIVPDFRNRVVIDLGDRPGTVVSDPIVVSLTGTQGDVSAGLLAISAPLGGAWSAFVRRAQSELGVAPDAFEVRSVDVEVLAASADVEELDEVWQDRLTVVFASTARSAQVTVAEGVLLEDRVSQRIPLSTGASNLATLRDDLLAGDVELVLFGAPEQSDGQSFTAVLEVSLVVAALDT